MQITRGKIKSAQKVVVYGPEGIGKSTFAAQFPGALFIDTEGSTKHLDVARTPAPSSWTMLTQQVEHIKMNPDLCQTLVVDTADWAERLAIADICAKYKKDGIEDFGYGKGYVYLAEEFGRFLNLLGDLIELGINVVLTAHAMMRKFEQPDEMGAYDRWEMKLQKKTAPLVKEWADMILFCNYKTVVVKDEQTNSHKAQGGKRVMYTTHHPCWDAKNRHDLPEELPLDFAAIAHCIPAEAMKAEPPAPHPQPEQRPKLVPNWERSEQDPSPLGLAPLPDVPDDPKSELEPEPETNAEHEAKLPKALMDLMDANGIAYHEIQAAVAERGYYPIDTPIENYDPEFINGVLIGAWDQVQKIAESIRLSF